MVEDYTDAEIVALINNRGGHDATKVYAAYAAALAHKGAPTVLLVQTVKGWTLGPNFEARNATHQMKKLNHDELEAFRTRLGLPITDEQLAADLPPYYHPGADSPEVQYALARRQELGGSLPKRVDKAAPLVVPRDNRGFTDLRKGSGKQAAATTMVFVRLLKDLVRDKEFGKRLVPVIPDEARTFGIDAMFPSAKIYNPHGQTYDPVDRELLLSYRENVSGQILHEGINEAGSMASVIAAGTSYATHGEHMIPVFVFYSMFGFQRVGDLTWAMGDQMGRGFLHRRHRRPHHAQRRGPAARGRPLAAAVLDQPRAACRTTRRSASRSPTSSRRRSTGCTASATTPSTTTSPSTTSRRRSRPSPSSTACARASSAASTATRPRRRSTATTCGPRSSCSRPAPASTGRSRPRSCSRRTGAWPPTCGRPPAGPSCAATRSRPTSGTCCTPTSEQRVPYVTQCLEPAQGPVVAVSDWMKAVPDQIAPWVPQGLRSLGTDGFGRSDTRPALRRFFKVDAESTVLAALAELSKRGEVKHESLAEAIAKYGLNEAITVEFAKDEASANEPGA